MSYASEMVRLVLNEEVDREQVETAAWDLNWQWWDEMPAAEDAPHEVIWKTQDDSTRVHLIEDHLVGLAYLLVEGTDAESLARSARSKLRVYGKDEIVKLAGDAKSRDDRIKTVYLAALAGSPRQVDADLLRIIERAFGSEETDVRHAAIVASGYLGWEPLEDALRKLAEEDPDEGVRSDARLMLEALEQNPPGAGA
jgi:hypothetical protein